MTRREAYVAGWTACMTSNTNEAPSTLDAEGRRAWKDGWRDAYDAPLGSPADPEAAGYYG